MPVLREIVDDRLVTVLAAKDDRVIRDLQVALFRPRIVAVFTLGNNRVKSRAAHLLQQV